MTVSAFFDLFLEELRQNEQMWTYYKFLTDPKKLLFRKAYFCQRLQYVLDHIGTKEQATWDCGSGYGTTALFLAMNGYKVYGSTMEFYFDELEARKKYWAAYGDSSLFECVYENILDSNYKQRFDTIILQDTLHHLEPIHDALAILHNAIKPNGKLLVLEENGSNIIQNAKLFLRRGLKKTVTYRDERLGKTLTFGNENIRSLGKWRSLLAHHGFDIDDKTTSFIRLYPPSLFKSYEYTISKEQAIASKSSLLRKYFYFGINFCCHVHDQHAPAH
jgi:SAM-dependent methyltransferase